MLNRIYVTSSDKYIYIFTSNCLVLSSSEVLISRLNRKGRIVLMIDDVTSPMIQSVSRIWAS